MKQMIASVLLAALATAICLAAEREDASLRDEVAVYKALIEAKQLSSRLKILTGEEKSFEARDDSNDNSTRKTLQDAFGDNASEPLENWFAKQGKEHVLVMALSKEQGWLLVDEAVIQQLHADNKPGTFWKNFYEKFPNSGGIVAVRRVGFNRRKDKAVVFVGQAYGDLGAEASWYYLERKGGKWSFIKRSVFMMA